MRGALRIRNTGRVLVLCYHGVSDVWSAPIAVTQASLERQLSGLLSAGYTAKTLSEALREPRSSGTVAVTFDDAYRSVIEQALPVLSELRIPGTVFAPTSFIGSEKPMSWDGIAQWARGPHARELVPMSWEELGQLVEARWEVGSHTCTHPRLPALSAASMMEELEYSRQECEAQLGTVCSSLAYPYGQYNHATMAAARNAGYEAACALARYVQSPVPMAWPRVGVYRDDGAMRFRMKISPAVARLRASPVWHARVWVRRAARRIRASS
jgi:peptidoglycan/xylan/chitin deacetylase (PgdA/CDA1 family)